MRPVFSLVIAAFLTLPLGAGSSSAKAADANPASTGLTPLPASEVELSQFIWTNRVVVVFADTPADPAFVEQIANLAEESGELALREVVVITDTDPAARTAVRQKLRPRGFSLVWIDKDGQVLLRKPSPWTARELIHAIDKTPLRQQEMLERAAPGR